MPSPDGSVTRWLRQLQTGDSAAAQPLWERYFRRLVGLARKRLQGGRPAGGDAEDVALSAFASFWRNAGRGRFPQLADRDSLWRLLVTITARKAAHQARDEGRQKRGGGVAPVGDAAAALAEALSREPNPDFAAGVVEECRRLLDRLGDPDLQAVARLRMEGYSVDDVAQKMDCAPRSVKRKLDVIRKVWEKETPP